MRLLIRKNLKYPEPALKEKIEGTVYLRYGIDYKGLVSEVKVLQSLGHGCDEEAERLVRLFKFKVPKNPRKLKVAFHKSIRINFNLPKSKSASKKKVVSASSTQFSYTIKKQKKPQDKAPSKTKTSYTYTINIG